MLSYGRIKITGAAVGNLILKENIMYKDHSPLPFTVHKLEWVVLNNNSYISQAHTQTQFEMICVTAGTGTHIINGEKYKMKSGSIYAALPRQKHQLLPEPDIKGYMLSLNPTYLHKTSGTYKIADESILHYFFSRHCQLDIDQDQIEGILQVIERLENELTHYFPFKAEIVNSYLQILLLYIRRELEQTIQAEEMIAGNPLLKKFLLLLEDNFKEKKCVGDYARQLFVTPNYLNRVVKKTSGYSAGYHIRQRIIQEAKRRAMYSGASLKEISYYLGFDSAAHFSKLFKNTSGMNFTEFKREMHSRVVL